MGLFDVHAHITHPRLRERREEVLDNARAAGVTLYTIGLGADVDAALLREVAGDAERALVAPDADDLAAIFDALRARVIEECP